MRFGLKPPPGWTKPSVATFEVSDLRALPADRERWMRDILERELPEGCELRAEKPVRMETVHGWPWHLVAATVVRGGAPIQRRLGAYYRFFEYGGCVLVRIDDADLEGATARHMLLLLATAEPEWNDEIVAVHQLWDS